MRSDVAQWKRERKALRKECTSIYKALATAVAHTLPSEPDLLETTHILHARRTALDLLIASADPQQGLFPDERSA